MTVAVTVIREWMPRFKVPEMITTDEGRQFESQLSRELCARLGIRKTRTTPYHPSSNGLVERSRRSMKAALVVHAPPKLFQQSHKKYKMNSCGTMRSNRNYPKKLAFQKIKKGDLSKKFGSGMTAMRWKDKREVFMISNMYDPEMSKTTLCNDRCEKPALITYYKSNMGFEKVCSKRVLLTSRLNYGIRNRRYQKHHQQLQGEWTRRLQFPDTRPTQDKGTFRKGKTTIVDGFNRKGASQCFKCNLFNHTAENCHLAPRCLKCGKEHQTRECQIVKVDSLFCINCETYGHLANYSKCPLYPKQRKDTITQTNYTTTVNSIVKPNITFAQIAKTNHPVTSQQMAAPQH
ncbi:PRE_C2HC domain-containing protein [Trichonephila clavipes]|nr:PRE_C2HC domain-containing protein [Trichonephila clavipes]